MKSSRSLLPQSAAVPPDYYSFFSFPMQKAGYSGVATYTRSVVAVPRKAEEGLTGLMQPKPPLTAEERVSNTDAYPNDFSPIRGLTEDLDYSFYDLDREGRTVVADFGLFVLINVYCPSDGTGTDERIKFKMDFHHLLKERVRRLVEEEGREVIVVGDLNACAALVDHCEGHIIQNRAQAEGKDADEVFYDTYEVRPWLKSWLVEGGGQMIDVVRHFWPDRKGMFTCEFLPLHCKRT
jgi:AP endonuclease-2